MSFSNETVKQLYTGDGLTTTFAIPFYNLSNNSGVIKVYLVDALNAETPTTDYTLSPDSVNPVNVVMNTAPTASQRLLIVRESPLQQNTAFSNTGPFQKEDYEKVIDRLTMQMQELNDKVSRAVLHSRGSGYTGKTFPVLADDDVLTADGVGNILGVPMANFASGTYNGTASKFSVVNHTTGSLLLTASNTVVYCSGGAAKTLTFPLTTAVGAGKIFLIFSDGNSLVTTISRSGADTFEGSTSFSMNAGFKWVMFVSDGAGTWHHNIAKQQEITNAMIADSNVGAGKWIWTNAASQSTGFTAINSVGYYPCNTTAGGFTATLPSAVSLPGKVFTLENTGTNAANVLTIDPNGTQTINGALTRTLYIGESITIMSDAANWRVIGSRSNRTTNVETAQLTPAASGQWHAFPDNSLVLTPGRWQLHGQMHWNLSGGSPVLRELVTGWHGAAGANSGSYTDISTLPGVTVETKIRSTTGFQQYIQLVTGTGVDSFFCLMPTVILNCTQNVTVYGNAYTTCTTPANARITGLLNATKIGE